MEGDRLKKMLKVLKHLYFFMWFFVLLGNTSYAYIDPSAVTYITQVIAALFIALGAVLTVFRHKIFALFKKGSKHNTKREIHVLEDDEADID